MSVALQMGGGAARPEAWHHRAAHHGVGLLLAAAGARAITSADCWVGGWTPEICCSAPGAKGNPLCWDHVFSYDKCCTETEEGIQFDLRRRNFVSDMVRRGATVHFDIRHVSGGRTGAVASRTLSSRSTVLRVPAQQVFSLKSIPPVITEAARHQVCDPHATLALGLAHERANPSSPLLDWIRLLPMTFANVLWFTERQLELLNSTFFAYITQNWFGDLDCMRRAAKEIPDKDWHGRRSDFEDLRWALSVVKTRGFAFEGTRESTMLIPLADFLNHNMVANVRTASLAEDALRFVATRSIMPGEELCIDYAQASNLEFMVRYGFRVEDNPYGGRQFDLGGEPLQAHCPSYILRYDVDEIIENATIDCHRQARYLSFEQQFGQLQLHEQLREDRYIYRAVEEACQQLLQMLQMPRPLSEYETDSEADGITQVLVREIRTERVLLQRCSNEFQRRQQEMEPRPVPAALAEPLARLRAGNSGNQAGIDESAQEISPSGFAEDAGIGGRAGEAASAWSRAGDSAERASAYGSSYGGAPHGGNAYGGSTYGSSAYGGGAYGSAPASAAYPDSESGGADYYRAAAGTRGSGGRTNPSAAYPAQAEEPSAAQDVGSFSAGVDRSRVDQLLQRLQTGASLV